MFSVEKLSFITFLLKPDSISNSNFMSVTPAENNHILFLGRTLLPLRPTFSQTMPSFFPNFSIEKHKAVQNRPNIPSINCFLAVRKRKNGF